MLRGRKKTVNPVKNPEYPGVVLLFPGCLRCHRNVAALIAPNQKNLKTCACAAAPPPPHLPRVAPEQRPRMCLQSPQLFHSVLAFCTKATN